MSDATNSRHIASEEAIPHYQRPLLSLSLDTGLVDFWSNVSPQAMELLFIDNNAPLDRRSQRLVRNHAMKGKNRGRVIPSRGHRGKQQQDGARSDCFIAESKHSPEGQKKPALLPKARYSGRGTDPTSPLNPFSGSELAYFTSSVPLTSSDRYLFYEFHYSVSKELYPRVFCHQPEAKGTVWFERVIEDPSVYHCAMAVTKARISHAQGRGSKPLESTKHLLLALRMLRHELGATSRPQKSTIVVTISLAICANLNGSMSESRTHLEGLKTMFTLLPGGLAALCSSAPEMGNKIRRCDQELALLAGTPTIFGAQPSPLPGPPYLVPVNREMSSISLPFILDATSPEIRFAMTDALVLCNYAGRTQLSAFQYQDMVISIIQRLIDYAPLGGRRPPNLLDDVCQLGLLAFMSTLLNNTRESGFSCSTLLSNLLWASLGTLDDEMGHGQGTEYLSLHLWLLFIYAVSAPNYESCCDENSLVAQRIRIIARSLGLETWEDVAVHLSLYPWVEAFHTEPGKRLWISCR